VLGLGLGTQVLVNNTARDSSGDKRYPKVTSLCLIPLLRLTPPTEGFLWDDLRKILHGGQRMAKVQNGEEILLKVSTP